MNPYLLHHLVERQSSIAGGTIALQLRGDIITYAELDRRQRALASGLASYGTRPTDRVAIYLSKSFEHVVAALGASRAGLVFVPINPLLKAGQVAHILRDCDVRVLVTSPERYAGLVDLLGAVSGLRLVILTSSRCTVTDRGPPTCSWADFTATAAGSEAVGNDNDIAGIFYTSGSTGLPKGVVVSHRNLVSGAASVASYLQNEPADRLLAALPLSFDAGFSQLTTAFTVGASAVLLDYLLPAEVLRVLAAEKISGMTGVAALWIQLAGLEWPSTINRHLRYFANTGGRMPLQTLQALRARVPSAKPYLMYGLTEAFRSTYLPPEEVDRRPDSIGKAIPNQSILVLRPDGSECDPEEPGELVHRGSTVALGYWGDSAKTAERFRPLPRAPAGLQIPEIAVFSGDKVRRDREGFLYFIGREDEMIKSSGYRISPTEVEDAAYASGLVGEVVAFGVEHPQLGQAVAIVVVSKDRYEDTDALLDHCRRVLPPFMVPRIITFRTGPLPRNLNGKVDRKLVLQENGQGGQR